MLERDFANYSNMREWVLSFGGQAEVLKPESLRADLLRQAEALLKKIKGLSRCDAFIALRQPLVVVFIETALYRGLEEVNHHRYLVLLHSVINHVL